MLIFKQKIGNSIWKSIHPQEKILEKALEREC